MLRVRPAGLLLLLTALTVGTSLRPPSLARAAPAAEDRPAPCHWVGRASRDADRLSYSPGQYQDLVVLRVERDLSAGGGPLEGERTVLVNSFYERSYFATYEIQPGVELEVRGYRRQNDQCVVDALGTGTLEPGYEGYLRPPGVCPTAGPETIGVAEKASLPLGCAVAPQIAHNTPTEQFQNGRMFWIQSIYTLRNGPLAIGDRLLNGGTWSGTRDAFRDPEPERVGLTPPAPNLVEPRRGFGKAWRERYGGPEGPLGWAVQEEFSEPAAWQQFEHGIVIVTQSGQGYILHYQARAWEQQNR